MTKLPERFEKLIKTAEERILAASTDIKALVIIGSVARGDWSEDSDVDIVCIVGETLSREQRWDLIRDASEKIQIIPFTVEELKTHFENGTTMAHSIRRGIVLFETNGFIEPNLHRELGPPSRKWMKKWFVHWLDFYFMGLVDLEEGRDFHARFCQEECNCFILDNLARAALNFCILHLESAGVIPVSKGEIRKAMAGRIPEGIVQGLELTLRVCHEDRSMSYDEAKEVAKAASWLKEKLSIELSVSEEDVARPRELYKLLIKTREERSSQSKKGQS